MFLGECKYIAKERNMPKYITIDIEISDASDKEDSDKEYSDEETSHEEYFNE